MKGIRRGAILLALLLSSMFGMVLSAQTELEVEILPPGEEYEGLTVAEWEVRWQQWNMSFPLDLHPGTDPTGKWCGVGQSGPVFFLPVHMFSSDGIRNVNCTIPEGVAILVPMGGANCSTVELPPYFGSNEEELSACATTATDAIVSQKLSVNRIFLPNTMDHRVVTPIHALNLAEGNSLGVPPGTALSVSDSYTLLILPPEPGKYFIEIQTQHDRYGLTTERWTVNVVSPTVDGGEEAPVSTPVN